MKEGEKKRRNLLSKEEKNQRGEDEEREGCEVKN